MSASTYNQFFTMHGTTMMFLFAVPIMEAFAMLLLPSMLGTRDMPFPRLSAFGFWCYAIGGVLVFSSVFFGIAPDGGWFMYPPLTGPVYSPGINADIWILGLGFVEIAAVAAAVELIVGILKTRAPGMTLATMPIFAWYMLVTAGMIMIGMPAVIAADILLELERAFDMPFYDADAGRRPAALAAPVLAVRASGGLHHLPAGGRHGLDDRADLRARAARRLHLGRDGRGRDRLPQLRPVGPPHVHDRAAADCRCPSSPPRARPSRCRWASRSSPGSPPCGRASRVLRVPMLFVLGFLFIFTVGGLTGVMVAAVPFDWQVHDTYFVVAHLHYVLIGGMVFPLFAAFYYWTPLVTGRLMSERLGRWAFWLMFVGFNAAFLPMHVTGLRGMPRRVYTYAGDLGWNALNLVSSVFAFVFAAGVLVFIVDFVWHLRRGREAGDNPWQAPSLEWLSGQSQVGFRSLPPITSRYPLWDKQNLREHVEAGWGYLPDAPTGERESLVTAPLDGSPEQIIRLPGPGWVGFVSALAIAVSLAAATFKVMPAALAFGAIGTVALLYLAVVDGPRPAAGAGGCRTRPRPAALPQRQGLASAIGAWSSRSCPMRASAPPSCSPTCSCGWAGRRIGRRTGRRCPEFREACLVAGAAALAWLAFEAAFRLNRSERRIGAGAALAASLAFGVAALLGGWLWLLGVDPTAHSYGAAMWALAGYAGFHLGIGAFMAGWCLAAPVARHDRRLACAHPASLPRVVALHGRNGVADPGARGRVPPCRLRLIPARTGARGPARSTACSIRPSACSPGRSIF